jgi:hypothetical protein
MGIPEFVDTYSDDLLYLIEARKVLLTHPFRVEYKKLCDASFSRLFIVFMVDGIEAMMQDYRKKGCDILDKYFDENTSNGERIQNLYEAFKNAGISVDKEVFNDYLATKYLRNTIVHARWKPQEKEWVEKREFPADTRELNEEHWYKILEVYENMMLYIALTDPELRKRIKNENLIRIKKERKEKLKPLIIRRKDLPFVLFNNLEHITSAFYEWIEKAALSEKYNWSKGLSPQEAEKMPFEEAKRLFLIAAKKAGKEGFDGILECKQLMDDALFFWNWYKQETFEKSDIQLHKVEKSLRILMELHKRGMYPKGPCIPILLNQKLPFEIKVEIAKNCLGNYEGLSEAEIIESLAIGKSVYDFLRNITPVTMFLIYFPIIDDKNTKNLMKDINFVLSVWKLRTFWYSYVEDHRAPDTSDLSFYERLFNELLNG